MYQGGTLDFSITPALDKAEGAYDQSPDPKYLLVLDKATHFAWADIGWKAARGPIVGYSLAFLNRHVKEEPMRPIITPATVELRAPTRLSDIRRPSSSPSSPSTTAPN